MSLDAARAEAARVAAHVDLRDVRLWGVQADLESVWHEDEARLAYRFNADVQVQNSSEHSLLLVLGSYTLGLTAVPLDATGDDGEPEPEEIANIQFNLNALFDIEQEPDEPFTESELTAFGETTGQFALYPYAREFVADLTSRMGFPTLHMGVMRLHLDSREG